MSEMRRDPALGRLVILASQRMHRPSDFHDHPQLPSQPGPCAFCPQQEDQTGEEIYALRDSGIKSASDWRVRVVHNKYPAVSLDLKPGCLSIQGEGPLHGCHMEGFGSHEVVIETREHNTNFSSLPLWNVEEVLRIYKCRLQDLGVDKRFQYVQIFKNHGHVAGASMQHSHSQIIALPIITPNFQDEINTARNSYDKTGNCVFCQVIDYDLSDRKRIIDESSDFIVLAPYAPRFPYETWILPRKHSSNYQEITHQEIKSLARILLLTLRKMDHALHNPPYNYMLQTAPLEHSDVPYYHWYICIIPHLVNIGGFELASGCHINPVTPEQTASTLREIKASCSETRHKSNLS